MTELDTERIVRSMRASGMTLGAIADAVEKMGVKLAVSTVWRICQYDNVRRPPLNALKRQRARSLALTGKTQAEISVVLDVSVTTVQRWCADLGLKRGRKTPLPNGIFAKGLTKK